MQADCSFFSGSGVVVLSMACFKIALKMPHMASHPMGTYRMRAVPWVNDKPTYARDQLTALWYAEGAWRVGSTESIGQLTAMMLSVGTRQASPDGVAAWAIAQPGGTTATTTARCSPASTRCERDCVTAFEQNKKFLSSFSLSLFLSHTL